MALTPINIEVKKIDATPTWSGILPMLLAIYTDGGFKGKQEAEAELRRMAKLADKYVAEHKGEQQ